MGWARLYGMGLTMNSKAEMPKAGLPKAQLPKTELATG